MDTKIFIWGIGWIVTYAIFINEKRFYSNWLIGFVLLTLWPIALGLFLRDMFDILEEIEQLSKNNSCKDE